MAPGTGSLGRLSNRIAAGRAAGSRIAELERRVAELAQSVAALDSRETSHARAIDELRDRPIHAVAATMAWIAQATLRTSPLVSVVLPTRNRAERLQAAIASVLAQTYERWELIVVDDGSDDETPMLLAAIDDPRVRAVSRSHAGVSAARNAALDLAAGELIAYLDDDNTMHPQWLKSVAWAFEQRPDVDVLYGAFVIDDIARTTGRSSGQLPVLRLLPYRREALADGNLADTSAIAHRAGLPDARFDEGLEQMVDWDMLARLTTDRDPLVLPAIASFYSTDAEARISARGTEHTDVAVVRRRVREARGLEPLPDDGEWTLAPAAMDQVLEIVDGLGPDAEIVECGTGVSTIAIARRLRERGSGRLHSLEHHEGWAEVVRSRLADEGLGRFAEVITAPLGDHPLAPPGCGWYDAEAVAGLPGRIDLLVVDGPPTYMPGAERQRYPALPALADRLSPGAPVILDDCDREGERWVLERWEAEAGLAFTRHPGRLAIANLRS